MTIVTTHVILNEASPPPNVILSKASLRAQSKDLTTSHELTWEILRKLRMTRGIACLRLVMRLESTGENGHS
jgi:hypothetical protein